MKIITISREFGAGGHTIGMKVAEELGIELYDKDIIRATAAETNLDYAQVQKVEEGISKAESFIRHITPISFEYKDYLFEAQKKVILELASKGPCVLVGRCAEIILKEAGIPALDVFLYASEEFRREWAKGELKTGSNEEALKYLKKKERERRAYYEAYTDYHFGDRHNYDLMLDSGELGYDICTKLIVALAKA